MDCDKGFKSISKQSTMVDICLTCDGNLGFITL